MRTISSQTWVTILDPLVVVDDPVRSLQALLEEMLFTVVPRRVRVSVGGPPTPRRRSWDEEGSVLPLREPSSQAWLDVAVLGISSTQVKPVSPLSR